MKKFEGKKIYFENKQLKPQEKKDRSLLQWLWEELFGKEEA